MFVGKEQRKVLVVGDRAGGNLAMALTSLLIVLKMRTPRLSVPDLPSAEPRRAHLHPQPPQRLIRLHPLTYIYILSCLYQLKFPVNHRSRRQELISLVSKQPGNALFVPAHGYCVLDVNPICEIVVPVAGN